MQYRRGYKIGTVMHLKITEEVFIKHRTSLKHCNPQTERGIGKYTTM